MKKARMKTGYYTPENVGKFSDALRGYFARIDAGEDLRVTISHGNEKMGEVPSVSLLPFISCPASCAGSCGKECYAAKIALLYKTVLGSYAKNTAIALKRPARFWEDVERAIMGTRFFRFHVSGDLLNAAYFEKMVEIAARNPGTEILTFTKKWDIVNAFIDAGGEIPKNLHIVFSGWENLTPENPHGLPESAVVMPGEDPAPGWKTCGGNCFNCACRGFGCWTLGAHETICFKLH